MEKDVEVSIDAEHHVVQHATCHKSCIDVTWFVQRIEILEKLEPNFQDPQNILDILSNAL